MEPDQNPTPGTEVIQPQTKTTTEEIALKETPSESSEGKSKFGVVKRFWFILVAIVIVLVLSLVGLWFGRRQLVPSETALSPSPTPTPIPSPTPTTEDEIAALENQGTSDEAEAIEADLEETDLSNLDKELNDIENELAIP